MAELGFSWNDLLIFTARITILIMILPVFIGFIFRKNWNRPLFIIFLYFFCSVLVALLEQLIIQYYSILKPLLDYFEIKNTFFYSIFSYLKDYLFLGWFFYLIFPNPKFRIYIKWISIILAIASIINYCFIEGYHIAGVFNPGVNNVYVVLLPLLYLWSSQQQSLRIPLRKNPYFWICLGLLIPNLLGTFLYFSGTFIHENDFGLYTILKSIKNGLDVLGIVFICIGFYHSRYVRFITD